MYKLILILSIYVVSIVEGDTVAVNSFNLQHLRIVGGQSAGERPVPYQASLRLFYYFYFCGGAVISNRWILTAGHCTYRKTKYCISVVVGTNDLRFGGKRYSVDDIKIHENYNHDLIYNDVSLVKVAMDIEFDDRVQPIRLPDVDTIAGAELLLTGWGKLSYPGVLSQELQTITLVALSVEECQSIYKSIHPVNDTQICTLPKEEGGACLGDSGSPLVQNDAIVGVVSWGVPCATEHPDVHTRIFSFKEWIIEKISEKTNNDVDDLSMTTE